MKILFSSTYLAAGEFESPNALRVGGQQVVQEAQLFRALQSTFYARGNHSQSISFSVVRLHNNEEDAGWFMLTHYAAIPKTGNLVFTIGSGVSERSALLTNAVLQGTPEIRQEGCTTFTTYNLVGGLLSNTEAPDIDPYADVIRTETIAIPITTTRVTVTFTTVLPAAPRSVNCTVQKANAAALNITVVCIEQDSITAAGFVAVLSAETPDATYKLSYNAFA